MTQHFKVVCKDCGIVINQCRCPSNDKVIQHDLCSKCVKAVKEAKLTEKVEQ